MSVYVKSLQQVGAISPPKWLPDSVLFEGITGSVAYGVSTDISDLDIVGFCMPPKELIFPHIAGEIPGFGTQIQRFNQYQEHHIKLQDNVNVDITIYSIVKFFQLAMENNPNMVDILFIPGHCVIHSTPIYQKVRSNRHLFLHKGCWSKFKGYAYSQLNKIVTGVNKANPKRADAIEKFGYDTKFAYHLIRLLLEVEQILKEHDLDLKRNADTLIDIRNGGWTLKDVQDFFKDKEAELEAVYQTSSLRYTPDEAQIKTLLLECIEEYYGN